MDLDEDCIEYMKLFGVNIAFLEFKNIKDQKREGLKQWTMILWGIGKVNIEFVWTIVVRIRENMEF